ncbi:MAG: PspA/IM30 family protein [Spirochaetaceae bacterium]|nr:MAG: PspA/IM30 family protein [Spirochaetaceae bacterium]
MGIFKRLSDVLKANINDMISKAENPEKMLNQMTIEMNEQLIEAKKSVASSIADEKRIERQMKEHITQAQDWEKKAMLAVNAGKDDLAKEALLRKAEYANLASQYKEQWEAQHGAVEKLKSSLRMLQGKIEEVSRKKNLLIARSKRADAQKQIQKTMGSLSDTSAFEVFDRMEAKIEKHEAEADAMAEIEEFTADGDLEKQFKELESGSSSADSMLEELKAKMQLEDKSKA